MTGIVHAQGVSRSFGDVEVLHDIDLDIDRGEIVALVGRSGSGKSTLLRIVAGLDDGYQGTLSVDGSRAVAFQEPRLLPWRKVRANVSLNLSRPGASRKDVDALAVQALGEVGLEHRVDAWPLTLSGGEAQRASLARALVREPDLLLLDEPFGALDALTRLEAHALLTRLWTEHGFAALLVTHDVEEAVVLADRVLVLEDGRIAHDLTVDVPRPRERDDSRLVALREQVLGYLGVGTPATTSAHPGSSKGLS
ncbi:MAG: ABC transporter ATP-binding protein [Gordonia sp. (in: high G+C Gram-positive bacteria)]|uniref:ABC transporter ATP-binding protein n=1 Tax=Gordonia sp. (in: high G+C Gram-positive bacteria) TaxID=84139 RepID=UPI0039E5B931